MTRIETFSSPIDRRVALGLFMGSAALALASTPARAARGPFIAPPAHRRRTRRLVVDQRRLSFRRLATGERFDGVWSENGEIAPDAIAAIDWALRDIRRDETCRMDPGLLDLLTRVQADCDGRELIVTSGFRTPSSNKRLKRAATKSLHLTGQAVDFYVPGLSARRLARIVAKRRMGGVGVYEKNRFVHADVGEVRYWRG